MPNWLKISLFVFIVLAISIGAVVALQFRKLPEAASVTFIQSVLAPELQLMREVAAASAGLDFYYNDGFGGDHGPPPQAVAVFDRFLELRPLQERAETIVNPIVMTIALKHSSGHRSSRYVFPLQENVGPGGWSPFSTAPSPNKPVVSWLLGTGEDAVRYSELVLTTNGKRVGFELMLNLELLKSAFQDERLPR